MRYYLEEIGIRIFKSMFKQRQAGKLAEPYDNVGLIVLWLFVMIFQFTNLYLIVNILSSLSLYHFFPHITIYLLLIHEKRSILSEIGLDLN